MDFLFSEDEIFGKKDDYEIPRRRYKSVKPKRQFSKPAKIEKSDTIPCEICLIKGTPVLPKTCKNKNPVIIFGAYPGVVEKRTGTVFAGDSGDYLHKELKNAGFEYDDIYESNILKCCRPVDDRGNFREITNEELKNCGWFAEKEIEEIQPKLIILCGELPVRYFLKRNSISPIRGQVKIKHGQKFLVTFNPAHIIRDEKNSRDREFFLQDLKHAYEIYKGISKVKERDYILVDSYEFLDLVLARKDIVSVDIETYAPGGWKEKKALDPYAEGFKILSISLSFDENKAFCILIEHPENKLDKNIVIKKLKLFLESNVPKIGQALKYDFKCLAVKFDIYLNNIIFDSLIASSLLDSRKGIHNLDRLALDYLGERSYKFEMYKIGTYIPKVDQLCERNCTDADYVLRLYPILKEKLIENELYEYFMEQRIPAISALARSEVRGLPVNKNYTENLCRDYEKRIDVLKSEIYNIPEVKLVSGFNINSTQDLQTVLFDNYKFTPLKETKTKQFSTDKEVLVKLSRQYPNNIFLKLIQNYKDMEKFYGTYLDPLIKTHIKYDNRVHPTFTLHITATGRLSCIDPNVQNVPVRNKKRANEIMGCYQAPEGYKIGFADYSQIELRILAQASQDPKMLEAFRNNEDLHQKTADEMGRKIGKKLSRTMGKGLNFGIVYGETKFGLADELGLYLSNGDPDLKTAQMYLDEYLNVYEGVKEYQKRQKSFLKQYGYVESLFGRKRWIRLTGSEKKDEEAYRKAGNTPIQSTASDINTLAFVKLVEVYVQEGYKSFPISLIHDAIMFENFEEEDYLKDLNICVMENLSLPFLTDVKLKVDYSEGKTWAEAKGK